jgi:hypothetical protein
MKKPRFKTIIPAILIGITCLPLTAAADEKVPAGWHFGVRDKNEYEAGTDWNVFYEGKSSAYITGKKENKEFSTLMQEIKADKFSGKRIRYSGYLKSKDISGWGGLWMRVDGEGNKTLSFDNMENRAVKGTTDWKKYDIVLDVPADSQFISFGILSSGKGTLWVDKIGFEVVDNNTNTTGFKNN